MCDEGGEGRVVYYVMVKCDRRCTIVRKGSVIVQFCILQAGSARTVYDYAASK